MIYNRGNGVGWDPRDNCAVQLMFSLVYFSVYVILGNYDEHMGLLMALDQRRLLDNGNYLFFINNAEPIIVITMVIETFFVGLDLVNKKGPYEDLITLLGWKLSRFWEN